MRADDLSMSMAMAMAMAMVGNARVQRKQVPDPGQGSRQVAGQVMVKSVRREVTARDAGVLRLQVVVLPLQRTVLHRSRGRSQYHPGRLHRVAPRTLRHNHRRQTRQTGVRHPAATGLRSAVTRR